MKSVSFLGTDFLLQRKFFDMDDEINVRDYYGVVKVGKHIYYNPGIRSIITDFMSSIEITVTPLSGKILYVIRIVGIRNSWSDIAYVKCLINGDIKKKLFIHRITIEDTPPILSISGRWDNKKIPFQVYARSD